MAMTTIALTRPAYERLKKQELPGESFSDVVLREIQNRARRLETCSQVYRASLRRASIRSELMLSWRPRPPLESEARTAKGCVIADTTFLSHLGCDTFFTFDDQQAAMARVARSTVKS
jgi:predicted CopG family antitoxin